MSKSTSKTAAAKSAPKASKPAKKDTAKKAAPAKKAPAKKAKAVGTYADLAANRFTSSKIENPVFEMWTLCNKMTEHKRKDVIAKAAEMGISYYTARTQYQLWLTAYRNS